MTIWWLRIRFQIAVKGEGKQTIKARLLIARVERQPPLVYFSVRHDFQIDWNSFVWDTNVLLRVALSRQETLYMSHYIYSESSPPLEV